MKKHSIQLFALLTLICISLFTSCVSSKKYEELQLNYEKLKVSNSRLDDQFTELKTQQSYLERAKADLELDKEALLLEKQKLEQSMEELARLQQKRQSDYKQETSALQEQIENDQRTLAEKTRELQERTERLNRLEADFNASKAKLMELEHMLAAKDSVTNALRRKVSDALLGFEGKGLSVTKKNGKVYVSLDEKLLFKSGSYAIEARGAEAIRELAKVLEVNPDINIMVEGHTDDVPYRGSGDLKDNWDLSVKRATTVVRTLLQSATIDPKRIVAAGRSEYMPIDVSRTTEGRQKNRRTEIILTPKLDELLELLEQS